MPWDPQTKLTTKITKLSNKTKLLDKQALGEGHECGANTDNKINVATKLVTPNDISINRMKHDYEQTGKQNQSHVDNTMSVCVCTEEDLQIQVETSLQQEVISRARQLLQEKGRKVWRDL